MIRSAQQYLTFYRLRGKFSSTYQALKSLGDEPYVLPFWNGVNDQISQAFLPQPPINFLDVPAIKSTMFVEPTQQWQESQIAFLTSSIGSGFSEQSREDAIGRPKLIATEHGLTSSNTIHHLYHIYRHLSETETRIDDYSSVVEWGGGYGNFAKLWWRLKKGQGTYVIIDTSLFTTIQWLYLSSTLGASAVHLLSDKHTPIKPGKINLVPLTLLQSTEIKADLFVSTWGLSESAKEAQDYVQESGWFGAQHLLIGFQDSTKDLYNASRLGTLAKKDGAKIIDIEFIPNNHYAFK